MIGEGNKDLLKKEQTTKQNRVWVRISAACNNICIFCLDSDAQNGKLIDEDIIKKQIHDGWKEGQENRIIISGGEASINPKFSEYIRYAKEVGYDRVQTVTNGNMFANENFCKKVFDAGLEEVTFSFHGHRSQLHDYLVATPGAFKKSLKGLIFIKKYYPHIIINIDIVVNKVNVDYLPDIIKFFMRLGVYEYDILQIIPFGRGFKQYKNTLFYNISEHKDSLTETWKLSRIPGMYLWTNRFHVEAFEGFENLIQDPRKIKSEVMGESFDMFSPLFETKGKIKPECYGERCEFCFLQQYCHSYLDHRFLFKTNYIKDGVILNEQISSGVSQFKGKYLILRGEEFPSQVYEKFGQTGEEFQNFLQKVQLNNDAYLVNIPRCLGGEKSGIYEYYNDVKKGTDSLPDYTKWYIENLYRKKSLRCEGCKYNDDCEGIHINFLRSYGFSLLNPIK